MTDREALAILRGSPTGTTEHRCKQLGIMGAQLARLVKAGEARVEHRTLSHAALRHAIGEPIAWFFAVEKK